MRNTRFLSNGNHSPVLGCKIVLFNNLAAIFVDVLFNKPTNDHSPSDPIAPPCDYEPQLTKQTLTTFIMQRIIHKFQILRRLMIDQHSTFTSVHQPSSGSHHFHKSLKLTFGSFITDLQTLLRECNLLRCLDMLEKGSGSTKSVVPAIKCVSRYQTFATPEQERKREKAYLSEAARTTPAL